ncbi:MAG TPA: thiamine pyrophosphate-dependent enzyme [Candidatus Lokiarchaeia archaeon]|nr:thiamine pyrophosphate-dependent enzyme [Candidatus Lokiarchaeia archaeon]
MDPTDFDVGNIDIQWCPGCGNFNILKIVKRALAELEIPPEQLVFVSGIGQAAKFPHYLKCNYFNGLHGRAVPVALAISSVNPELTVICESGEGCTYGEGGNHFIHNIRRNPKFVHIVHDNMVYGLTKGQASPTSLKGMITPVQVAGVILEPFNPLTVAIALDASFVARIYAGDTEQSVGIVKQAMQHEGYACIDVLQPCPSFNKLNTYQWFQEHVYYLEESHDPGDRVEAFKRASETEMLPLGIFYLHEKPLFHEQLAAYKTASSPLVKRGFHDVEKLRQLIESRKE